MIDPDFDGEPASPEPPQIDLLAAILPTVVRYQSWFPEFVDSALRGGGLNASQYKAKIEEQERDAEGESKKQTEFWTGFQEFEPLKCSIVVVHGLENEPRGNLTELGSAWAAQAPLCRSPMYLTEAFDSWVEYWPAPSPIVTLLVPQGAREAIPSLGPGHIRVLFPSLIWIHLIAAFLYFRLILRRFADNKALPAGVVVRGQEEADIDRPMEITVGQTNDDNGQRYVERMWTFGVVGIAGFALWVGTFMVANRNFGSFLVSTFSCSFSNLIAIMYFSLAYLPYVSYTPSALQPTTINLIWQPLYHAALVFWYSSIWISLSFRWSPAVENYFRAALAVAVFASFYLKIADVLAIGLHFWVALVAIVTEGLSRFFGHVVHTRAFTAAYIVLFMATVIFETFCGCSWRGVGGFVVSLSRLTIHAFAVLSLYILWHLFSGSRRRLQHSHAPSSCFERPWCFLSLSLFGGQVL